MGVLWLVPFQDKCAPSYPPHRIILLRLLLLQPTPPLLLLLLLLVLLLPLLRLRLRLQLLPLPFAGELVSPAGKDGRSRANASRSTRVRGRPGPILGRSGVDAGPIGGRGGRRASPIWGPPWADPSEVEADLRSIKGRSGAALGPMWGRCGVDPRSTSCPSAAHQWVRGRSGGGRPRVDPRSRYLTSLRGRFEVHPGSTSCPSECRADPGPIGGCQRDARCTVLPPPIQAAPPAATWSLMNL